MQAKYDIHIEGIKEKDAILVEMDELFIRLKKDHEKLKELVTKFNGIEIKLGESQKVSDP